MKEIAKLLDGTDFTAEQSGQRVVIKKMVDGKSEYVADGTPAEIIDFLEAVRWLNERMEKSIAAGSIFL